MITCSAKTDVGLKRSNNEDIFVVAPDKGFLAVADGMGGEASGEIASQIFADTVFEVFSDIELISDQIAFEMVKKAFLLTNQRILSEAEKNPEHRGMGCTAELLVFFKQNYVLGHVGDSRSYLFRNGELKQATKDHSFIQDQIDKGLIMPQEAKTHRLRHVILRAVGVDEALEIDIIRGTGRKDDIFLLCSDGLTDMVDDDLIRETLSLSLKLNKKAERLIELAKSAGGRDNITVALCEVM